MGDGANMVEYRQVIVDHIALAKRVRLSLVKHTIEVNKSRTEAKRREACVPPPPSLPRFPDDGRILFGVDSI